MDYAKFQVAVVELAHQGTRLTVANVVARLSIDPQQAERLLDRMTKEGRLDLELDENEGIVVYSVRGLSPRTVTDRLEALRSSVESTALQHAGSAIGLGSPKGQPLPPSLRRSVPLGAVLGGFLPGVGLAYSAPWHIVLVAMLGVFVGFKLFSFFWLGGPFILLAMLASGAAGALYTIRYNQTGKRSQLTAAHKDPSLPAKTR